MRSNPHDVEAVCLHPNTHTHLAASSTSNRTLTQLRRPLEESNACHTSHASRLRRRGVRCGHRNVCIGASSVSHRPCRCHRAACGAGARCRRRPRGQLPLPAVSAHRTGTRQRRAGASGAFVAAAFVGAAAARAGRLAPSAATVASRWLPLQRCRRSAARRGRDRDGAPCTILWRRGRGGAGVAARRGVLLLDWGRLV